MHDHQPKRGLRYPAAPRPRGPWHKALSAVAVLGVALAVAWPAAASAETGDAALQACLDRLRPMAGRHGLTAAEFDTYTRDAKLLEATVQAARSQPEQRITWWDYLARVVDQERVDDGKALLAAERDPLDRIAYRFEVDPEVVVAIFGVETNYGRLLGSTPVLDAWLTRACVERRPLWESNAFASIRLLRDGIVEPEEFAGSWSGAFGMTQFIPTSFYELAVDGDGDGRIDLYESLPDALASAANHLRQRGARWQRGLPAVIEVQLPDRERARLPSEHSREIFEQSRNLPLTQWRLRGVRGVPGGPQLDALPNDTRAAIFAPTGGQGPIFLVTRNFDALLQYNRSTRYALAVGMLANQLAGGPGIQGEWPTEDPGLSRAEVRELQRLLIAAGHDIGAADGIPGARTREALASQLGVSRDARIGRRALDALRATVSLPEGEGP
ncbi:MAG: lytic murein transglycosylase [Pigmentiphaga sp.]|nr:lytic murein transglycosylase [Pigmentiphaga sp.]